MAQSILDPTQLSFTSDGTDINAAFIATDDTISLFSTGGANNSVAIQNSSSFQMIGSTSGTFTQQPATTTTSYGVTWPSAQGSINQVLSNDGSGTLSWVDITAPTSLTWKESVVVATTVAGTLATDFENGDTIDGVTIATGDRILIKDQADATENGIYIVQATGAPARSDDLPTGASASGVAVIANQGTDNADSGWVCTTDAPNDVVGTDTLSFQQFASLNPVNVAGTTGDLQFNDGGSPANLGAATNNIFRFTDTVSVPTMTVGNDTSAVTFLINGANQTTADTAGTNISLIPGQGNGTGTGGSVTLLGGQGGATADGGVLTLLSGNGGITSGNGGNISLTTGNPNEGSGGNISLTASNGVGTDQNGGGITITSGAETGAGTIGTIRFQVGGLTAYDFPVADPAAAGYILATDAGTPAQLSWVDPATIGASPAGVDTDIQFNNAGSFGADTTNSYKYDDTTLTMNVGNTTSSTTFTLQGEDQTTLDTNGTSITINLGNGNGAGDGGLMTLMSGNGGATGNGGNVIIDGGEGGTTSGNGGSILVTSGLANGASNSGDVGLFTGDTDTGTSGTITFETGETVSGGTTGNINFNIGDPNGATAGTVTFTAGDDAVATAFTFRGQSAGDTLTIKSAGETATSTTTGTVVIPTGGLGVAGNVYATAFNATSDATFKKNISRIEDPLNKLLEIEGYTYDWKDDNMNVPGKKQMGVIAQQLEKIGLTDIVTGNEGKKAVNYAALIPIIIEAIKEIVKDLYD